VSDAIEKYTPSSRARVCPSCGFFFRDSENDVESLQAELETMKKERDESRNSVEQWRELLWKTLPLEVSRLACEQARQERDEARLKCDKLEKQLLQAQGGDGDQ